MENLTDEQKAIITETITNEPGNYGIQATAGSGKSFTIFKAIDYIKEHEPNAKILYLVFNKRNQIEAQTKLLKYSGWREPVEVKTAHSFALAKWRQVIGPFSPLSNFDWSIITSVKNDYYDPDIKYSKRAPFTWLLNKFCSAKCGMNTFVNSMKEHFDDTYEGPDKATDIEILGAYGKKQEKYGIKVDGYSYVSRNHIDAFQKIYDKHIKEKLLTHSMYLKLAAMSDKTGGSHYDYVFFDEAQDANQFMLKLLFKQDVGKVYFVGDERQSIYKFDGSNENVFETLDFKKTYTLSKSFRFGESIAELATDIIQLNTNHKVYGTEQTHDTNPKSFARLYRTNAKLFEDALDMAYDYYLRGTKLRIDFLKTSEDDNETQEIMGFLKLYYMYMRPDYYRAYLDYFPKNLSASLTSFEKDLKKPGTRFLDVYNLHYDNLSDDVHHILTYAQKSDNFIEKYDALKLACSELNPSKTIYMLTMHRSKGLEWDSVVIAEPTRLYYKDKEGVVRRNPSYMQELNLAYVACTRARKNLDATALRWELLAENDHFNTKLLKVFEGHVADGLLPIEDETEEPETMTV